MIDRAKTASVSINKVSGQTGYIGSASGMQDGNTSTYWGVENKQSVYEAVFSWTSSDIQKYNFIYRLKTQSYIVEGEGGYSNYGSAKIMFFSVSGSTRTLLANHAIVSNNNNNDLIDTNQQSISILLVGSGITGLVVRIESNMQNPHNGGPAFCWSYCYEAQAQDMQLPISVAGSVICLGDTSDHGGTVNTTGGNTTRTAAGTLIATAGATHTCPIIGHGTTPITPIITKTFAGGKLILTYGAVAGCGAKIYPPDRKVYANS